MTKLQKNNASRGWWVEQLLKSDNRLFWHFPPPYGFFRNLLSRACIFHRHIQKKILIRKQFVLSYACRRFLASRLILPCLVPFFSAVLLLEKWFSSIRSFCVRSNCSLLVFLISTSLERFNCKRFSPSFKVAPVSSKLLVCLFIVFIFLINCEFSDSGLSWVILIMEYRTAVL